MTQNLQAMLALANEEAEHSGIDMNEAVKGGGGARLLPEGYAFAQLVEYIEFGNHPQEFNGKAKDPALEFAVGFALTGQGYQNDDGTPYIVRPYSMAMSRNEKAKAFLLFKALNWKGTAKNFAQLLGQKWLVKIEHGAKSKTDATIVSRLDLKSFLPPLDPVTKQPYGIPDAPESMYKLFLWSRPTKAGWDALFIEGQYEAKDNLPARSKNRLQEQCLAALDFQGSPLQALLGMGIAQAPVVPSPAGVVAPAVSSVPVAVATPPSVTASAPVVAAPVVAASPVVAAPLAVPQVAAVPPGPAVVAPAVVSAPVIPAAPVLPV